MINPITQLQTDQQTARSLKDANADICFLALSETGRPTVRTLVLRSISEEGFTLFISKTSPKWHIIQGNAEAELLLWYSTIQRQYRIQGKVQALSQDAIDRNWPRRPAGSKYLDHAYTSFSPQSTEIESREALVAHIEAHRARQPEEELSIPATAAGIRLVPTSLEMLDLNAHDRIHDRRRFTLDGQQWHAAQLMP
jgi:pyridoxamine 5'-phosphate oxidase